MGGQAFDSIVVEIDRGALATLEKYGVVRFQHLNLDQEVMVRLIQENGEAEEDTKDLRGVN